MHAVMLCTCMDTYVKYRARVEQQAMHKSQFMTIVCKRQQQMRTYIATANI